MKGKENKGNRLRRLVVGILVVSLFASFTTGVFAIGEHGGIGGIVNIESSQMTFTDGTMFNLEANALFPPPPNPAMPIMGRVTLTFPMTPPDPCMAEFTGGVVTQTSAWLFGQFPPGPVCSAKGLSGAFTLMGDTSGTISLMNADGATIATGMGKVVINNAPLPT